MSDYAPPGCTEEAHDAAFAPAPGYEEFCEEFAGGDHDAAERVARAYFLLRPIRSAVFDKTREREALRTGIAVLSRLMEEASNIRDACDALSISVVYDAMLLEAWREHNDRRP